MNESGIVGEAVAKLKEQTERRKIDDDEIKVDERDKRRNERIWMKKRSDKMTNAKIVRVPVRRCSIAQFA